MYGKNNIKSELNFIGIKDNQLSYKCKKCYKKWFDSVNEIIKKFSIVSQFCNDQINLFCC